MNSKYSFCPPSKRILAGALTGMFLFIPAVLADEVKPGIISISATGTATLAPNMAILNLAVVRQAKTARQALSKNSEAMAEVINAMKKRGIEEKDLQTSSFNISPRYNRPKRKANGAQEQPKVIGYSVHNGLVVRVRELSSLGEILDQVVTLGVNSGGGMSFSNSDPDGAIDQARKDAMAKAVAKAQTLTNAAGVKLARVLNISEQQRGGIRPQALGRTLRAESAASSVPVAAGENSYSVTVNVQWELAQ